MASVSFIVYMFSTKQIHTLVGAVSVKLVKCKLEMIVRVFGRKEL